MIAQSRERSGRPFRSRGFSTFGLGGANGGGGHSWDFSIFFARLQSSLVPEQAAGSSTPTFTRATTAYQEDFEGKLTQVLSGEPRFQGARRVRNWIAGNSENLTIAGWSSPNGGSLSIDSATQVTAIDATASNILRNTNASRTWATTVVSFVGARISGTGDVKLDFGDGAQVTVALTTTPTRYSATLTKGAGTTIDFCFTATGTYTITRVLSEDVTGQSNQNPSEYVSVGVLSAPFHGANVDGVKYFTTLNANTVASNVVTEATGAAIVTGAAGVAATAPVDASGPKGYIPEGARTNRILQSQTFDNGAWVKSGVTIVADQYVAPDGTTTMGKLTAAAATDYHYTNQTFTYTAAVHTLFVYVRYVNHRWISARIFDGTSAHYASFDLLNGLVGAIGAGVTATITTISSGVYRVTVTSPAVLATAGDVAIFLNNSDSASGQSWAAAGTEIIGIWGAQLEAASFASSYIPTTTVAVQRNADVLTYVASGNISGTVGAYYLEVTADPNSASVGHYYLSSNGNQICYNNSGVAALTIFDGTTTAVKTLSTALSATPKKIAASWGGSAKSITDSGAVPTSGAFDGDLNVTTNIAVGNHVGSSQPFGTIRNVKIFSSALSAAQLQALTA